MTITCVLAAVANLIVERMTGLNPFTFKVWVIVPVGALLVGMLAASGGILAARVFDAAPNWIDAILMVVCAAVTMWLIYYLDYATLILDDGRKVADFVGFRDFVDLSLTKAHMRFGKGARDFGEVGQAGYWLAVVEFVGFLFGGGAAFALVRGMARCTSCGTYLRKIKSKQTRDVTLSETRVLLRYFMEGDIKAVTQLLELKLPANRTLKKDDKHVIMTYDLLGCPKCKAETLVAKVSVFNGKQWNEVHALERRRDIAEGLSLRDKFA
jgi:hypothetical protein